MDKKPNSHISSSVYGKTYNGRYERPSTSEELRVFNFLDDLGQIDSFSEIKSLKLDSHIKEKVFFEDKIDLYSFDSLDNASVALSLYLIIGNPDPTIFIESMYKSLLFSKISIYRNIEEYVINEIVLMKAYAAKSDYFDSVPDFQLSFPTSFPENGEFYLPWEYVTAHDGSFTLYHPNHVHDNEIPPYVYPNLGAREDFNKVQMELLSQKCQFFVTASNGKIYNAGVSIDPSCAIQVLTDSVVCPDVNLTEPVRMCLNHLCPNADSYKEIKRIEEKNSIYLNTLCRLHILRHSVKYCKEQIYSYSGILENENAYIFCIAENEDAAIFVYENQNPNRCTYLIRAKKDCLEKAVDAVSSYLASKELNKREKLARYTNVFAGYGVTNFERILHDNFYNWKSRIDRFLRIWIR